MRTDLNDVFLILFDSPRGDYFLINTRAVSKVSSHPLEKIVNIKLQV